MVQPVSALASVTAPVKFQALKGALYAPSLIGQSQLGKYLVNYFHDGKNVMWALERDSKEYGSYVVLDDSEALDKKVVGECMDLLKELADDVLGVIDPEYPSKSNEHKAFCHEHDIPHAPIGWPAKYYERLTLT